MRGVFVTGVVCAGLAGLPLLAGCEREIAHEQEVEVQPDGTIVTDETTVTEDRATGDVTITEEQRVDPPPAPRDD